jgi:hypothetical protein
MYQTRGGRLAERFVVARGGHAFRAWRRGDEEPDASGTTEALRAAAALWEGARAFGRDEDGALAISLLEGYADHAWRSHGVWMIRNYFNFGTEAFATNSYLIDYDPDLMRRVARATDRPRLRKVARRSARVVKRAQTEAGLLHQVIQPEIRTLRPGGAAIFSPNNRVQLSNTAAVAERSVEACPEVARAVARFVAERPDPLAVFYNARTGAPGEKRAGTGTYTALLRMVVRLRAAGHHAAASRALRARLLRRVREAARAFARAPQAPRMYTAGELLLALEAAEP